jgi:hypothetical protein
VTIAMFPKLVAIVFFVRRIKHEPLRFGFE